jgi:AcrR family transcriptional regulator
MGEVKRYRSPVRAQQALENRRAVLRAARELFVEQGYGATTIEQIAKRAGVSKPTVFNSIGNKVEVFRTVRDIAMAGDDEPQTVTQRSSVTAIAEAPGLEAAVRAAADHIVRLCRRYHPIHVALSGAAGTDLAMAELYEEAETQRHLGAGHLLSRLAAHGRLRPSRARAQDRLWLLMAPDHYARLVHARGWSERAYRDWLAEEIRALFSQPRVTSGTPRGTPPARSRAAG